MTADLGLRGLAVAFPSRRLARLPQALLAVGTGVVLLAVFSPEAEAQALGASSGPEIRMVASGGLHVRQAPDLLATSVAVIPRGRLVCVVEREGAWARVRVRVGRVVREGYMSDGFLGDPPQVYSSDATREFCRSP